MQLTSGKIQTAQKIVIYGPEGVGKNTLANQFPSPVFIDIEHGTNWMDVKRMTCHSWQDILDAVKWLKTQKHNFKTAILDTADWADRYCVDFLCAKDGKGKTSIEAFGYGKGFTFLAEEFGRLLKELNPLVDSGVHVVFLAHSTVKKMELPDAEGAYDHYEMKCSKFVSPLLKEWAEAVLFINYRVNVTESETGRTKAVGGRKRIIHTQHTAAYDAKNRWGLPDQIPFALPFDFGVFAKVLGENVGKPVVEEAAPSVARPGVDKMLETGQATLVTPVTSAPQDPEDPLKALKMLMELSGVAVPELMAYLEGKEFIPKGGMVKDMDKDVYAQLIQDANWDKAVAKIRATRVAPALEPEPDKAKPAKTAPEDVPPNLLKLMVADKVFAVELKAYCEEKSFIPKGGKLTEIPLKILGQMVLVSNWAKVVEKVKAARA